MKSRLQSESSATGRRRGILGMELVVTLPILLLLLLGIVELTCLFLTYGSVVEASRAGARRAALHAALDQDACEEVQQSLGSRLSRSAHVAIDHAEDPGDEVVCSIRVPMTACAPNLLWPIGFDLEGRSMECVTCLIKE